LPMMKLSNSRKYLEYELMIINLWGTWHHYQLPLLSFSICSLFLYMLVVFTMPLCSKFLITWWLTCFWGLYLYYYYYYSFCELVWTRLMAILFTSTRKWTLAMLFSMGRNLGFTCLDMRLVNMCLGSKMLYTRSTTIMTIHL
jgi:hypothetical protein